VARIPNLEVRALEHRLEKPAEGDVLLADVFLDFGTRPSALGSF
jgi:hypothetical protein